MQTTACLQLGEAWRYLSAVVPARLLPWQYAKMHLPGDVQHRGQDMSWRYLPVRVIDGEVGAEE